jgi:hypothetical protein
MRLLEGKTRCQIGIENGTTADTCSPIAGEVLADIGTADLPAEILLPEAI